MICQNCHKAGEENTLTHYKRSAQWHDKCDDKGCVCQHKTGPGYVKRADTKVPLMQTQSPQEQLFPTMEVRYVRARVLRFVAVYIVTVDAQQLSILMTIYISAIPAVRVAMQLTQCAYQRTWSLTMASNVQSKLLLEAAQQYAQAISPKALAVLNARGICEETAARFQLGSITNPINGHEMYEGWLSIPYITASGGCVGFKFRRLDDLKPKYGSPTGQKAHLYNVCDITLDSPYVVVCEGELDAIVTSGELGIPAVGVPGVAAWKNHFPKLFAGYETIYVVGDNDIKEDGSNPGAEFAKRVANEVMNSQIVTLPPGMDINDYYLANGIDATRKLLIGESNV